MESNVRSFLIAHGLIQPHELPNASGEFVVHCISCKHHKPKLYISALGRGAHCKVCDFRRSWRGFQRLFEPPSPEETAYEHFTVVCENTLFQPDYAEALEYLRKRGFTDETIRRLRFGYCDPQCFPEPQEGDYTTKLYTDRGWWLEHRIIIPYIRDGIVTTVRGRSLPGSPNEEKRYLELPGSKTGPYTPGDIDPDKPVYLCEGEFDAALLNQENGLQTMGFPGASHKDKSWYEHYPTLYICFDGDKAGRDAATYVTTTVPEIRRLDMPEGFDVSEYLGAFGKDSFQRLIDNSTLYIFGQPQKEDRFEKVVEAWADWAFTNGALLGPTIKWAPRLEKALSGWSPGLFLLGAEPNSGKSCLLVKSAYECATENSSDTIVVYLSLDDEMNDAMTRFVSLDSKLSFELIRNPRFMLDHPTDACKRNEKALERLHTSIDSLKQRSNLVVRDATYGRSLNYLRTYFESLRKRNPDKHLVIFVDSLAKISAENDNIEATNKTQWKALLASELKYLSTMYRLCIVTPTDFRKINDNRLPTNDDLKDAKELEYEAVGIMLGFNEVHKKGLDRAIMKWRDAAIAPGEWPLFQIDISKNKRGLFKGKIRLEFYPPTSDFRELTEEEDKDLQYLIDDAEREREAERASRRSY